MNPEHQAFAIGLRNSHRPAICKGSAVDRNQLPDEIKYHDVDDAKARERLLNGLDPVIKLIGCSNGNGVVLYKGETVYTGSLNGGQIAITPGGLYFAGSPPDENIFHELAKLRIFLAREIFKQMIAVENPTPDLNQADMILRRELKVDYLAGQTALAIDKDSGVFDAAALHVATYAKPIALYQAPKELLVSNKLNMSLGQPNRIIADELTSPSRSLQTIAKTDNRRCKRALAVIS